MGMTAGKNVVPTAAWTKAELEEFAQAYPGYVQALLVDGVVSASLFAGINVPSPVCARTQMREPEKHPGWIAKWAKKWLGFDEKVGFE